MLAKAKRSGYLLELGTLTKENQAEIKAVLNYIGSEGETFGIYDKEHNLIGIYEYNKREIIWL